MAEHFKTQQTIDQKVETARRLKDVFGIEMFYCDPARPDDIASFNKAKIPAVGAKNDIRSGIDRHWELIKTRRYKIFRGTSPHTEDEIELYHYPSPRDDANPDKDDTEDDPVDKDNHAMDANRYVTIMTYEGKGRNVPFVPGDQREEDQYARLERLKRRKVASGSERWS